MERQDRKLKWILTGFVIVFFLTFLGYAVKSYLVSSFMKHYQEPPATVSTVQAKVQTWHPMLTAVGSLHASKGVEVNSQVNGQVVGIYFTSGSHVKEGDLLVQLDDKMDQQTLARDEAKLRFDQIDYERKQILRKENAIALTSLDAAKAAYLQTQAAVASDKVVIAQKQIRAPFSGRIGIRQVNIGQFITSNTAIVSLQALDPLYVDFSLPEQNFPALKTDQPIDIRVDAYPNRVFNGKVTAINSVIDVGTRTIDVRGTIPNPNETLFPGLFADVNVLLPVVNNVITLPQSAVTYTMYGDSAYVVIKKGVDKKGQPILKAVQKYVTVGDRRGNVIAITKGIQAGDEVVTSGQLKLHPGSLVVINNAVNLN